MDKASIDSLERPILLPKIRLLLREQGISALLIRSTDRYFNEYVPKNLSLRAQITGFDGSVGDAIVTKDGAHLFVDGRYSVQARMQAKEFSIHVCDQATSIEKSWVNALPFFLKADEVMAYDPNTIDLRLFEMMEACAARIKVELRPDAPSIFEKALGGKLELISKKDPKLRSCDLEFCGRTPQEKLAAVKKNLEKLGIDGFLVVKLDDIAWLTNFRSHYFPYQTTFPSVAIVFATELILGLNSAYGRTNEHEEGLITVNESEIFTALKQRWKDQKLVLGIDRTETSKAHEIVLRALKIELKQVDNPISLEKAIKNEKELLHLRSAFKKADEVVHKTRNFAINCFEQKRPITEADINYQVALEFEKSGSTDLSFRPICAASQNGAIIHYGTPDNKEILTEGTLFLLDTGAYYEGGYATDLTRTFLLGTGRELAKPWQKEMFTLVLKASIRGLSARLRRGSLGMQLDAIVREPLWHFGLDFAHGTGHGVGINVHEFPPRISGTSTSPLLEGQVFSIEPGLYFEGLGGVRIENLATIVADPDQANFVRVQPLTFCPLDNRLIDENMLDKFEKSFLEYYQREWENKGPWPNLPPLPDKHFSY